MGKLERVPGKQNWVDHAGGLPDMIERIAVHLHREQGMSISHAIAVAVNAVKKGCATGDLNFPGSQSMNAGSRAQYCSAVRSWEAKKAGARVAKGINGRKLGDEEFIGLVMGGSIIIKWGDSWKQQLRDYRGRWTDMGGGRVNPEFDFDQFQSEYRRAGNRKAKSPTRGTKSSTPTTAPAKAKVTTPLRRAAPAPVKSPPVSTPQPAPVKRRATKRPASNTSPTKEPTTPKVGRTVRQSSPTGENLDSAVRGLTASQRSAANAAYKKLASVYGKKPVVTYVGPPEPGDPYIKSTVLAATSGSSIYFYNRPDFEERKSFAVRNKFLVNTGVPNLEATFGHEMSHVLHKGLASPASRSMFNNELNKIFGYSPGPGINWYNESSILSRDKRALGVSIYASTDPMEFVAEALLLHAYKPGTNKIADQVGEAFKKAVREE